MDITGLIPSEGVARELGIDRSTLSRWMKKGRIRSEWQVPGYRGRNYFTREEINRVKKQMQQDHQDAQAA